MVTTLRDWFFIIFLALLTSPLSSQAQSRTHPATEIDLHTDAEWRVNAQIQFDSSGRLLILYRDKFKLNPSGNWHLVRLTNPFSGKPLREEITFSIPQEPVNPRSEERWINFYCHLVLNTDGSQAYATFSGAVVTMKPGPPPATGGRNVNVNSFSSAASFDLTVFRLVACAGFAQHSPVSSGTYQIDADGNLLVLDRADTDWKIQALDKSLREIKSVAVNTGPIGKKQPLFCQVRLDYAVECSAVGGDPDLILGPQSTIQIPRSACKTKPSIDPTGFGKDEQLVNGFIQTDRICVRNDAGLVERVSPDLLPRCHQGWEPDVISSDHHSLLISCSEFEGLLDTFFYTRVTLQLIDALTFEQRMVLPLSSRRRSAYTVFHRSGVATIAVLEDGVKLKLYNSTDKKNSNPPA